MFIIIIWIVSLCVLMVFCVPIIISICVPSFFLSHSGGMPVCTINSESTCPMFIEPTYVLTFHLCASAAMVYCVPGSNSTPLKIQQSFIQLGLDPPPNTIGFVLLHPTSLEGFTSGYFFGRAHGKQDRERTTIISIFLLCTLGLYVAGV